MMQRAANGVSMSGMQVPWPFSGIGAKTSQAPSRISKRAPQGRRAVTGAPLRNYRPGRPAQVGPMSLGRTLAPIAPSPGPKPWKSLALILVPALILLAVLFPADSASAQTRPKVTDIDFIGLPNSGDAYRLIEKIRVLVTFDKDVTVDRSLLNFVGLEIGSRKGDRMVRRRNRRTCGLRIPRGGWRHGCRRSEHPGQRDCRNHRGRG